MGVRYCFDGDCPDYADAFPGLDNPPPGLPHIHETDDDLVHMGMCCGVEIVADMPTERN